MRSESRGAPALGGGTMVPAVSIALARRKLISGIMISGGWSTKKAPSASFSMLSSQRPEKRAASMDLSYCVSVLRSTWIFVPPQLSASTSPGVRPAIICFSRATPSTAFCRASSRRSSSCSRWSSSARTASSASRTASPTLRFLLITDFRSEEASKNGKGGPQFGSLRWQLIRAHPLKGPNRRRGERTPRHDGATCRVWGQHVHGHARGGRGPR